MILCKRGKEGGLFGQVNGLLQICKILNNYRAINYFETAYTSL